MQSPNQKTGIDCTYCNGKAELVSEHSRVAWYHCKSCKGFTNTSYPVKDSVIPRKSSLETNSEPPTPQKESECQELSRTSGLAQSQRERVFEAIKENKFIALCELKEKTRIQNSSLTARLDELHKQKKICQIGWKKIHDPALGRKKTVMVYGQAIIM